MAAVTPPKSPAAFFLSELLNRHLGRSRIRGLKATKLKSTENKRYESPNKDLHIHLRLSSSLQLTSPSTPYQKEPCGPNVQMLKNQSVSFANVCVCGRVCVKKCRVFATPSWRRGHDHDNGCWALKVSYTRIDEGLEAANAKVGNYTSARSDSSVC